MAKIDEASVTEIQKYFTEILAAHLPENGMIIEVLESPGLLQ